MGKRKGYRKAFLAVATTARTIPGNPKPELVRRGRGRPRKINREQSLKEMGKIVSVKGSKPPKKPLTVINPADSSSVWTLVPKEFVNSEYFKSHIIKLQQRAPRGRRPKKTLTASQVSLIPQIPFTDREKIKVQYPQMSPVTTKTAIQQHLVPLSAPTSRPIVIHFNKTQMNGYSEMETNWPVLKQINISNQQQIEAFPSEELRLTSCMQHNNINGAVPGCVYGHSQVNLKRNEHLIRDALSGRKQIYEECNSVSNLQYGLQSYLLKSQEHKMEQRNELVLQSYREEKALESPPKLDSSNPSYRQVIADAIRILYDEESVLGYV